jgi:hypothetical protein
MSFVKATMRVIVNDYNDADYYVEEATKIEVDEDDDEADETLKEMKNALLERARELEREELPNVDEVYEFLCENRWIEMINNTVGWQTFYSPKIYIEGEDVMISFVTDFESCKETSGCSEIEELEDVWNEEPFYKSRVGGSVGNYCKMPSQKYLDDLLCELTVDVRLDYVTDETGETVFDPFEEEESDIEDLDRLSDIEEESEEDGEVKHPFYMTHEDLFGPKEIDLDEIKPVKKQTWSERFIPKPIRGIFKRNH